MKDLNLKDRVGTGWDLLLLLSIVAIVVACGLLFLQTKPAPSTKKSHEKNLHETILNAEKTEQAATASFKKLKDRTWDINAEVLGSQLLNKLTDLAEKNHLKVDRFSMGSTLPAANLQEARFNVTLEGAFMDVMAVVKTLELPESKVVLNDLKIAASSGSDHVSTSMSLTGFLYKGEM